MSAHIESLGAGIFLFGLATGISGLRTGDYVAAALGIGFALIPVIFLLSHGSPKTNKEEV